MEPMRGFPVDLTGPHALAAIHAAERVLQTIGAPEVEVLLAASFLTGLRAGIMHFAVFQYFAVKAGGLKIAIELPGMGLVEDLFVTEIATVPAPRTMFDRFALNN